MHTLTKYDVRHIIRLADKNIVDWGYAYPKSVVRIGWVSRETPRYYGKQLSAGPYVGVSSTYINEYGGDYSNDDFSLFALNELPARTARRLDAALIANGGYINISVRNYV